MITVRLAQPADLLTGALMLETLSDRAQTTLNVYAQERHVVTSRAGELVPAFHNALVATVDLTTDGFSSTPDVLIEKIARAIALRDLGGKSVDDFGSLLLIHAYKRSLELRNWVASNMPAAHAALSGVA